MSFQIWLALFAVGALCFCFGYVTCLLGPSMQDHDGDLPPSAREQESNE